MPRYAARTDENHAAIREGLRELGFAVWDCARYGGGFPDLLVGRGDTVKFVEVKSEGGKLTPKEAAFKELYRQHVVIAHAIEDVLEAFGLV
jgi:hypothetical protein